MSDLFSWLPRLRRVRIALSSLDDQLWILPHHDDAPAAFNGFPLPKFTPAQMCLLAALGIRHRRNTGRCLAVLLIVDTCRRTWKLWIPWQLSRVDSVTCRIDRIEGLDLDPHDRLGGMYQSTPRGGDELLTDLIPPMSGLFMIHHLGKRGEPFTSMIVLDDDAEFILRLRIEQYVTDSSDLWLAEAAKRVDLC